MRRRFSTMLQMVAASVLILCAMAGVCAQQLDENCTVSVLNRTVRVNHDGSWVLPNIPANFGQVKARATCVRNGVTMSGESAFFTIPANGAVNLPTIILGATTQIPAALTLTPPTPSFTAAGQTAQLTVTATYSDSSTRDVTAGSTGTNYTTSNSAIATVSANGLVTAVASGSVVIQATNDGSTGIIRATVVLSNVDSDGDGIPDDVEISLGLDPHNPVDAQEDFDRDGLTNLREFQLGTNIRVFDTDGDGIGDGLEVQTGSNPLDPNSFNLAQALQSIQVAPAHIVLVVNTIIGEASQQLNVTGRLIDGNPINLTSRSRGTNYNSSNLAVANFGAVDGLVFAGNDGAATITVSNSGFMAVAQVSVSSFVPTALSFIAIPGFANNVDVAGNFAYVAAGATGLQVVDVTDRRAPRIVGALDTPGNANDVKVVGNTAYVADGAAGLRIIDVTNPANPSLLSALDTPGEANDVVVVGNRAYIADGPAGLQIVDISDPRAPHLLGTFDTPGNAKGVDVSGNVAVIADGSGGIRTVDVSNPASPSGLGSLATTDARDVTVAGNTAYVAGFTGSLIIVDISTPATPHLLATTPQSLGGILVDVAKAGDFVFGADEFFVNGVPIVNVSLPANPVVRARLDFPARDDNGTGIAVDNVFIYLTADQSLQDNGVNGDSRLYIGQYLALEDTRGVAPLVKITSPTTGATVTEGETIPVTVQATDDVQVASVNFLVNGVVVFTDSATPYEFNVVVPAGVTSLTLGATAVDLGGNVGVASNVQINVIPDPLTTVTGRVVDGNLMPLAGASVSVLGRTSSTGADGRFTISSVPTVQGNLVVLATFSPPSGPPLTGTSAPTAPVQGGTTNVGDIAVVPALFDPNLGTLVLRNDDGSVTRTLPFSFSFYGTTYNQVFVNNNGNLSFSQPDSDFTETIAEFLNRQPRMAAFWDDIEPDFTFGDTTSGLYINDQLPGRLVVTWLRQLEYSQVPGPSTIQVILFSDGRIQFGYQGVASLDAIVGLSPGGLTAASPLARTIDFSNTPFLSLNAGESLSEQFELPTPRGGTDPPGSGQNSTRNNPFDLDGGFIVFTPKAGGGYDVRTILPPPSSSHGTVTGTVLDAKGQPVSGAEVEILSSRASWFHAMTNTDAQGRYVFSDVPCGGKIIVRAKKRGSEIGQGVGEMPDGRVSININVRPSPPGPPKN